MDMLTRTEEILLLAIWKLDDGAYGTAIREQVERDTGRRWMPGAVYAPLNRLRKNGYVRTSRGNDEPPKSGRPRIYYSLTPLGRRKLAAAQAVSRSVWRGVPDLAKEFES